MESTNESDSIDVDSAPKNHNIQQVDNLQPQRPYTPYQLPLLVNSNPDLFKGKLSLSPSLNLCADCKKLLVEEKPKSGGLVKSLKRKAASCRLCATFEASLQRGAGFDFGPSWQYMVSKFKGPSRSNHAEGYDISGFELTTPGEPRCRRLLAFFDLLDHGVSQGLLSASSPRCIWRPTEPRAAPSCLILTPEEHPFTPEAIQLAKQWLSDCQTTHQECIDRRNRVKKLPRRVLDVNKSQQCVALYSPKTNEMCQYATLSYCWGTTGVPLKTTTENLQSHCEGIAVGSLPATLKDAVLMVRALGIPFLWIDALCIIQEGDGGNDWAQQSAEMTSIYQGGLLNISAVQGNSCESGLRTDRLDDIALHLPCRSTDSEHSRVSQDIYLVDTSEIARYVMNVRKPLLSRGWAFQERIVSPASLHFTTHGIVWECCSTTESETRFRPPFPGHFKQMWNHEISEPLFAEEERTETMDRWYKAVQWYSSKDLTFEEDRLPALAGLAAHLSRSLGLTYLAGIWKEDLVRGLSWMEWNFMMVKKVPPPATPSWSWISGENVTIDHIGADTDMHEKVDMVKLHGFHLVEEHPGTFGRVRGVCRLDLEGQAWTARVEKGRRNQPEISGLVRRKSGTEPMVSLFLDRRTTFDRVVKQGHKMDCCLILLANLVPTEMNVGDEEFMFFLALEEAKDVQSDWGMTYRRFGIVQVRGRRRSKDGKDMPLEEDELVPRKRCLLSLV